MSPLLLSLLPFLLFSTSWGHHDRCLVERKQKVAASAESGLTKCQQYSSHSCCSQEHIDAPPFAPYPWEGCGTLSPRFDACKEDLLCSGYTSTENNCSKGCITYTQKFGSGEQLCDTIWRHSFVAVTEACFCITPLEEGADISQEDHTHADLDAAQEGSSGYPEMCSQDPHKIPHKRRMRRAVWKRHAHLDGEGSGSGIGA
ncbi:hypothetical protein AB205_0015980 [Aquarana catesbeiana]|uniref:Folate receptor-like domain-containing protein n=1 Tax=Aquarana catesbeiana TaxID=8400 RepID=A0A2G9SF70_AQUCT|nr:hypothetical protein AB205_0015980 [Aquarana catesbeiana]PIO38723.1 hypothetical protein AB205_0015980 [Aquarana catesbeiana]